MNLTDKIKGAMFGVALGDALGLGTEFMSTQEVRHYYPGGMRHFSQIIRDAHRRMWKRGEWTNDTQINILLAESIMSCGRLNVSDFAKRIKAWFKDNPTDMVDFYRWLFKDSEWENEPLKRAHRIWLDYDIHNASNEALPRAIITGILGGKRMMGNTLDAISMTHDHTRCAACGMVIATMADSLLRKGEPAQYTELVEICNTLDPSILHSLERAHDSASIYDLELDDENALWHTRKTMAAALWAIWHCSSAEETLHCVVDAGGDADTNAAVAMGLAGLKYGYDALPEEVNNLLHYDVINDVATRFAAFIEQKENR